MSKGTVNRVTLLGRLGQDPDVKYTSGGTAVAKLTLATTESVKKNDQWEDQTEWHRVVVWGKQAEFCSQYVTKGKLLYVEGALKTTKWEDNNGVTRYTTEVVARDVQLIGGSNGSDSQNSGGSRNSGSSTNNRSSGSSGNSQRQQPQGNRNSGSSANNRSGGGSQRQQNTPTTFDDFGMDGSSDEDIPF